MKVIDVINTIGKKLHEAVQKETFQSLSQAERELNEKRSIKMLGKCRFQHAVTERWDNLSQDDFEQVLHDRCL